MLAARWRENRGGNSRSHGPPSARPGLDHRHDRGWQVSTVSWQHGRSLRLLGVAIGITACIIASMATAATTHARGARGVAPPAAPVLTNNELLAEAAPDECFAGVGVDYPPMNEDGSCPEGVPKTNESYIWGYTEESGKLWFGTMANTLCILSGQDTSLARQEPGLTAAANVVVCEFGDSEYARTFPEIPDTLGDWRPPRIYAYDLATGTLAERKLEDPLIRRTLGFRGAGSIGNTVFLGGPSLLSNSVNLFAFRADTGQFLGACEHPGYDYIREWEIVDGVLYVGAGSATHGAVLRWDGDMGSFAGNFCADFTEVGRMSADAATVTSYTGGDGRARLAVTTVPIRSRSGTGGDGGGVGVWISPPLGAGGLTAEDAGHWRQVWSPLQYDPDRVTAQFGYAGGAIHYFDGWLYWGTIHLQHSGALRVHQRCTQSFCFGVPETPEEEQSLEEGVYRSASVWRGRNLENSSSREIQLLYGESELPACIAPKMFAMQSTGWTPLYGPSGFGTRSNEYIWQMAVYHDRLFVGTYDAAVLQGTANVGADLWRFDDSQSPAVNENSTGLGDRLNYGIRAMAPLDDGSGLIVGMANPFNLATGGGWELRRLREDPPE
jgi:hypothetical protein